MALRRWAIGVVVVLGLLWLLASRQTEVAAPAMAPAPSAPPSAASPSAPPSVPPSAPPPASAAPPRVRVPRPPPSSAPAPRRVAADPASTPAPPPSAGMVDRRKDAPPDAAAVREALVDQMDVVKEAVLPCVSRWSAVEPGVAGAVTLAFQLDADGLTDVWIQDHTTVPDALLSCFADAVYASDWAGISREPLQVTWPFRVSDDGDDNGPEAR